MLKQQKGMTLLALVFTIIAMLALAAVAIAMVLDELKYDPEPEQITTDRQVITTEVPQTPVTTTETPLAVEETPVAINTETTTAAPTEGQTPGNATQQATGN